MVAAVILGTTLVSGTAANAAGKCASGHFCAFDGRSYAGTRLVDSATSANTTVEVADNRAASGINNQGRKWCGVDVEVGKNRIRARWAAHTSISDLSPYNDTIDFFWAGTAGDCG